MVIVVFIDNLLESLSANQTSIYADIIATLRKEGDLVPPTGMTSIVPPEGDGFTVNYRIENKWVRLLSTLVHIATGTTDPKNAKLLLARSSVGSLGTNVCLRTFIVNLMYSTFANLDVPDVNSWIEIRLTELDDEESVVTPTGSLIESPAPKFWSDAPADDVPPALVSLPKQPASAHKDESVQGSKVPKFSKKFGATPPTTAVLPTPPTEAPVWPHPSGAGTGLPLPEPKQPAPRPAPAPPLTFPPTTPTPQAAGEKSKSTSARTLSSVVQGTAQSSDDFQRDEYTEKFLSRVLADGGKKQNASRDAPKTEPPPTKFSVFGQRYLDACCIHVSNYYASAAVEMNKTGHYNPFYEGNFRKIFLFTKFIAKHINFPHTKVSVFNVDESECGDVPLELLTFNLCVQPFFMPSFSKYVHTISDKYPGGGQEVEFIREMCNIAFEERKQNVKKSAFRFRKPDVRP